MKNILLLLIACFCSSCFTNDSYEQRHTQAGWLLFHYADATLDANYVVALRAAQFDEYLRQTTDEGRQEVHNRYFPRERIVYEANAWWILSTRYTWIITVVDGRSLDDPGAEWGITYRDEWGLGETDKEGTRTTISGAEDGPLIMRSTIGLSRFITQCEVIMRVPHFEGESSFLEFLSGGATLQGRATPRLDVAFAIEKPVVYKPPFEMPEMDGLLSITAHNEVDNADEQVTSEYLPHHEVKITYCGKTEIWDERGWGVWE